MAEPKLTAEQKGALAIAARRLGEAAGQTTASARAAILAEPERLTTLADECDAIGGGASGLATELRSLRDSLQPRKTTEGTRKKRKADG